MKKIILLTVISFTFILFTIIVDKSNVKADKTFKIIPEKVSYYKNEYKSRYSQFAKKNPNLPMEDVITRVNIGLDNKYYTHTKISQHLNKIYILVNKYTFLPDNYIPNNLEFLDTTYSREGMSLVKVAKVNFEKMYEAAKKDGIKIRVMSSYRDYLYQIKLYNKYKQEDGEENADKYSARPGFSEHQTGLCVDIDNGVLPYDSFEKSNSYKWMLDNSYKYGFIERYPRDKEDITGYIYEAWHYRYVGKKIAKYIHDYGITFDEYYVRFIEKN